MPFHGLGLELPYSAVLGTVSIPAIYQWSLNFFYGQNSQYIILGVI
jgi:hypothetical protein